MLLETCGRERCWGMAGDTLLERGDPQQGWDIPEGLQPIGDPRQDRDAPEGLQPMGNPCRGRRNKKEGAAEKQKKRIRSKERQK